MFINNRMRDDAIAEFFRHQSEPMEDRALEGQVGFVIGLTGASPDSVMAIRTSEITAVQAGINIAKAKFHVGGRVQEMSIIGTAIGLEGATAAMHIIQCKLVALWGRYVSASGAITGIPDAAELTPAALEDAVESQVTRDIHCVDWFALMTSNEAEVRPFLFNLEPESESQDATDSEA